MKSVQLREAWDGHADCLHCTLRTSVLFAGLEEKDFERIHHPIDQFVLRPGAVVYHAGEPGHNMFTVRTGMMKLVQYLPDGGQRIVRLARATDVIGLECLVKPKYQHDAIVLQPTEVCRFPVAVVQELSRDNPALHQELMNRWERALEEADAWLTELSTGSARERVARLLLRLVNGDQCSLFSREDMGAMLGITTETASRTIAEFKRKGLMTETAPNEFALDLAQVKATAE